MQHDVQVEIVRTEHRANEIMAENDSFRFWEARQFMYDAKSGDMRIMMVKVVRS